MRGKSDGVIGIATMEEVDLVEFDVAILGGIKRDAVVDGQRDMTVTEKRAQFAAEVDGTLVERSCHRNAAGFADGLYQFGEVLGLEARVERFLDVADIVAVAKVLVDEAVNIAHL